MSLFEPYRPSSASAARPSGLAIRPAMPWDLPRMAALGAQRLGTEPEAELERLRGELERIVAATARKLLCVAVHEEKVIGFARVTFLPTDLIDGARGLPPAWYLTGVVVDPSCRRRGVGAALTQYRIDWVAERASRLYFYANSLNQTSQYHA